MNAIYLNFIFITFMSRAECYQTISKHLQDMFRQRPPSLKVLASPRGHTSPDVALARAPHVAPARAPRSRRQETAVPASEPEVEQCQPRPEVKTELGGRGGYRGEGPGMFGWQIFD